jgi:hypothetical protein
VIKKVGVPFFPNPNKIKGHGNPACGLCDLLSQRKKGYFSDSYVIFDWHDQIRLAYHSHPVPIAAMGCCPRWLMEHFGML